MINLNNSTIALLVCSLLFLVSALIIVTIRLFIHWNNRKINSKAEISWIELICNLIELGIMPIALSFITLNNKESNPTYYFIWLFIILVMLVLYIVSKIRVSMLSNSLNKEIETKYHTISGFLCGALFTIISIISIGVISIFIFLILINPK